MLNYIWLGLLILGIGTALVTDIVDQSTNRFKNGEELAVILNTDSLDRVVKNKSVHANIKIKKNDFNNFYSADLSNDIIQPALITIDSSGSKGTFYLKISESSPAIWKEIARVTGEEDDITGEIKLRTKTSVTAYTASIILEKVSFTKTKEVTNSAIDYAGIAVKIALGLIGIMALWLGVMKVAEEAGLVKKIANAVKPVTKFLFPEIPHDHPAMSAMVMNISANMLGLGNAATPFGLKAMEELEKINPNKGTATNAMCTFLAVNTAGLTLIPATAIAVRAALGSTDPAVIIGTSIFGASCATVTGITAAKIFEKFPLKKGEFGSWLKNHLRGIFIFLLFAFMTAVLLVTGTLSSIFSFFNFIDKELVTNIIQIISIIAIPLILLIFLTYGAFKKVKVYEVFVEGAKEGFNIAVRIIPYLVAMLVAIGIFRAGGAMNFLTDILSPFTDLIGMPPEAMQMALMRPLSGSGSIGIMTEIMSTHGPDSFIGILVSTILGSTETTFYVIAVYFGAVNIKKTRHALPAGLLADAAGILGALFIVKLLFG